LRNIIIEEKFVFACRQCKSVWQSTN